MDTFHLSKPNSLVSQHGNKLYKLYVKDSESYSDTTKKTQPIGQVIVKETWNVREMQKDSISKTGLYVKQSINDKKWYTPTTISELFIMFKEKKNEKNDEGWIYGIARLEKNKSKTTVLENGKNKYMYQLSQGNQIRQDFRG